MKKCRTTIKSEFEFSNSISLFFIILCLNLLCWKSFWKTQFTLLVCFSHLSITFIFSNMFSILFINNFEIVNDVGLIHDGKYRLIGDQPYISQLEKIVVHFWSIKWLFKNLLFFFQKNWNFLKNLVKKKKIQYLINKNHILRLLYRFIYGTYNYKFCYYNIMNNYFLWAIIN